MNSKFLIARLAAGASAIEALLGDLSPDAAAWRCRPGKWSVIEVLCHLRDEEREDFRVRLDYTLHRTGESWPAIDPSGWVVARDYAGSDKNRVMAEFLAERENSLAWLRGLESPDWSQAYEHPLLGRLSAGDLLASWVAHDLLHLRQLAGVLFAQAAAAAEPYGTDYAGVW